MGEKKSNKLKQRLVIDNLIRYYCDLLGSVYMGGLSKSKKTSNLIKTNQKEKARWRKTDGS